MFHAPIVGGEGSRTFPDYLHRSAVPLDQADLSTLADHGQLDRMNECEGMCGV